MLADLEAAVILADRLELFDLRSRHRVERPLDRLPTTAAIILMAIPIK
jgi:hypothetical protein